MSIRFKVEDVFILRAKSLMAVATGHLLEGDLVVPVELQDERTKAVVKVLGIDQLISKRDPDLIPLLIARESPTRPKPGMILVDRAGEPENTAPREE